MTADRVRQRTSVVRRPNSPFERTCHRCGTSFMEASFDGTHERGIWNGWTWFCSIECRGPIDAELPGAWERADFMDGAPDEERP